MRAGVDGPVDILAQAEQLIALGALTGILGADEARAGARALAGAAPGGSLLVVHPRLLAPSTLVGHLRLGDKPGFVVEDMGDVDDFAPTVDVPDAPLYALAAPDRGDDLANRSPEEAVPALAARGRTPMLLTEGLIWAIQRPEVLERNHCYMTAGSRLRRPNGSFDARTPALWIANGTGRDGAARRGAPKVGWCWWGNRHTWLGFASTTARVAA